MGSRIGIYIDVTNMLQHPFITGIQRVVREGTKYLINSQDKYGWAVRLLQWDAETSAYKVLDNEKYLLWLEGKQNGLEKHSNQKILPEQIAPGSIFFDIDSVWPNFPRRPYLYSVLKHRRIKIAVLVHDVLPITHPQFSPVENNSCFPLFIEAVFAYSDLIFTTTAFTSDEIANLIHSSGYKPPPLRVAPLGSDFINCRKSDPRIDPEVKDIAKSAPYILTVATLEPRKNHKVILDAYDQYLRGTDINVIFAGRRAEKMEPLLRRIHTHPQFNKRIFHFEGKNDETISYLYQKAMYTVFPTYAEGFGIPAVESLVSGTPALLSDIPVLREAAGDYADYFSPDRPEELAKLILDGIEFPEKYREKRERLLAYQPTTWDDFGEKIAEEMKELF